MNYSIGQVNGLWYVFTAKELLGKQSGGGFQTYEEAEAWVTHLETLAK